MDRTPMCLALWLDFFANQVGVGLNRGFTVKDLLSLI